METLLSDRAARLARAVIENLSERLLIKKFVTYALHPHANVSVKKGEE